MTEGKTLAAMPRSETATTRCACADLGSGILIDWAITALVAERGQESDADVAGEVVYGAY